MDELKAKEAASRVASEEIEDGGVPETLTLSTGIVLRLRPVPQAVIRRAASKVKRPEVPMFHNADKDRDEENPDHPDYRKALETWIEEQAFAIREVILILGTEPLTVPQDMELPDGETWFRAPQKLGLITEAELADEHLRYLAWLEIYAGRTERDQLDIMTLPIRLAGITEGEVMAAITSFRGGTRRGTDNGTPAPAGGEDGNHLSRATRRARARGRGT
jgi:hypothetical protein